MSNEKKTYDDSIIETSAAANIARNIQESIQGMTLLKEVGILFSVKDYYSENEDVVFVQRKSYIEGIRGIINILSELHYNSEILQTSNIQNLDNYKTIVVSNIESISCDVKEQLLNYAKNGGNLIIVGDKVVQNFTDVFETGLIERTNDNSSFVIAHNGINNEYEEILCKTKESIYCKQYAYLTFEETGENNRVPLVFQRAYGNGTVNMICFEIGDCYNREKTPYMLEWTSNLIGKKPFAYCENHPIVDVIVWEAKNKKVVFVINNSGAHAMSEPITVYNVLALQSVPISILSETKPYKVLLNNEETPFIYENKRVQLIMNELKTYNSILLQYED